MLSTPDTQVRRMMRALEALEKASSTGNGVLRLVDLSGAAGLPLTTTHRLVNELCRNRLVDRVDGGYCLGTRIFELGEHVPRKRALRDTALPFMEDVYGVTRATVHLGVLDRRDVLYIDKIGGHNQPSSPSRVGGRVAANCTALGKVILAYSSTAVVEEFLSQPLERRTAKSITDPRALLVELKRIRKDGYAVDREEAGVGLGCVATPIRLHGEVIGAISASMAAADLDPNRLAPLMCGVAVALSRRLANGSRPA